MKVLLNSSCIKRGGKGIPLIFLLAVILLGCNNIQAKAENLKGSDTGTVGEKKMRIILAEKSEPEINPPADKPAPGNYETATFGLG